MAEKKGSSRSKKAKKEPKLSKTAERIERAQVAVQHAGLRFNHKHEVFIAKLKRGEVWALNQLSFQAKATVTPLFEMWPPNPATPTKPAKTLAQHTEDLMRVLASEWTALPTYLDTQYLETAGAPSPIAAQTVFGIARSRNVNAVPVTSPFWDQPFQTVIRNVIAADGRGVMFRLPISLFNNNNLPNLPTYLGNLASVLQVERGEVDILIDLQYRPNELEVEQLGAFCVNNLAFIDEWRTVTLASGCFPNSISAEPMNQWIPFSRTDWLGWSTVAAQRVAAHARVPSYGDYGVRCGGEPLVIPNTPAPNIRYTDDGTIWVRKAAKAQGATRSICTDLVGQAYFRGAPFSQGDAAIAQIAANSAATNGTAEQWILVVHEPSPGIDRLANPDPPLAFIA